MQELETNEIESFIEKRLPHIRTHGGGFSVRNIDESSGSVTIKLKGNCKECALSPMTEDAIENRLMSKFDTVQNVSIII